MGESILERGLIVQLWALGNCDAIVVFVFS